MRRTFLFLFLSLLLPAAAAADLARVTFADGRSYLVTAPAGVANPPLIVALHGGGGSPEQFERTSGLTRAALRAGFAIVYPAGSSRRGGPFLTWNGLYCCGHAAEAGIDDTGFLDRVIADAGRRLGTEPRACLTGMSNGAIMAQTYAAARPGRASAVATVAGTMDAARLRIAEPVPFLHIHGTSDPMVPYAGGIGDSSLTRTDFAPVGDVVEDFLRPHGRLPRASSVIDARDDGTRVVRTSWGAGARPAVVLLTVEGGGHVWPGGRRARGDGASREIDAADEVVRFCAAWR